MRQTRLLASEESPAFPIRLEHGLQVIRLLLRPEITEGAASGELVRGETLRGAGLEKLQRIRLGENAVEILGGDFDALLRDQRAQDGGVLLERVGGHDDAALRAGGLLVVFGFGEHGEADRQIADEPAVQALIVLLEDSFPPAGFVLQQDLCGFEIANAADGHFLLRDKGARLADGALGRVRDGKNDKVRGGGLPKAGFGLVFNGDGASSEVRLTVVNADLTHTCAEDDIVNE